MDYYDPLRMIMNLNDTIIIHKSSLFELSKMIQNDPDVQNHTATFRHCPPRGSWRPISLRLRLRMPLEFWKSMPDRTEVPSGSSAACPDWNFPFFWTLQMFSFLNCLIQTSLTEWWISSRNLQSMVRPSHGENSPNNDGLTIHKLVEHLITPSWWAVGMCLTPLTSLKILWRCQKKLGVSENRQPPNLMVCDHIPHEHGSEHGYSPWINPNNVPKRNEQHDQQDLAREVPLLRGPDFDNIVVEHGRARVYLPLNDVSFFKNGLGWDAKAWVIKVPSLVPSNVSIT